MRPLLIHSADVPQANAIDRVHLLAKILHAHDMERLAAAFPDRRDRAFYFHAARLLGFVSETDILTPNGRQLGSTEGVDSFRLLAAAFSESRVGSAWMTWAEADDVRRLDPHDATPFLRKHCRFSEKTQQRRASTLAAWVQALRNGLPPLATATRSKNAPGGSQLSFTSVLGPENSLDRTRWPAPSRFPHNEGGAKVGSVLSADLADSDVLIVSGYSALGSLVEFLGRRDPNQPFKIRLLLGTEPFPAQASRFRTRSHIGADIRDHWLSKGISVLLSGAIIHARDLVISGRVEVRTARTQRPIHAKMYVSAAAVTLGSSNYTSAGLAGQSEANTRFANSEKRRYLEAKELAEGLWAQGTEYTDAFLELLDALLKSVTWQEALARACASILEGEWARKYIPPSLLEQLAAPLWRHQIQGISQAMWVLENVGSVLVADAAGSGKTRMGAWLIRGAFDRQYRLGFVRRPAPLILAPPQVTGIWEEALHETGLNFQVESHGPLSTTRASRHETLVRHIGDTELLAVDEAHNFVNRSDRTLRLITHYAENAILFTATPINRSAGDLLSLVELLGADNLSDRSLEVLASLRRRTGGAAESASELEIIRKEIHRFTVRRTRAQLNEISDEYAKEYRRDGRQARYPRHQARYYPCVSARGDDELAIEISVLADRLSGVTRLGKSLRPPPGMSDESYLRRVVASARALARHHVMSCLRSSRAALTEHALGTDAAVEHHFVHSRGHAIKASTGNMARRSLAAASHPPSWDLETEAPSEHRWLWDCEAHAEKARNDAELYRRIGELSLQLSDARECSKVEQLQKLLRLRDVVIGFDSHVISLRVFEQALLARQLPVECLTGEGGQSAKRRAVARLGLGGTAKSLVALCTDAFSEGLNLQKASCVVHLDTPTVIRLAEQRAGRVDRMNSPHDQVEIYWPKDSSAFAPQRRDLLRTRHEVVKDLIGANLTLPDENAKGALAPEDLADEADVEKADEVDSRSFYDAFRGVREMVAGRGALVPKAIYEHMRTSQADVVACVSILDTDRPWCFMSVGGLDRAAPRWVFLDGIEAQPELDLTRISDALRERLGGELATRPRDDRSDYAIKMFAERLREREHDLLPVRRRRALVLLESVIDSWIESARGSQDYARHGQLRELREWLCLLPHERRESYPDPGSVADAWLRLIRPRVRRALEKRRNRRKPWRLEDLLPDLERAPIPLEQVWRAFDGIQALPPVDVRIVAMIVGVGA